MIDFSVHYCTVLLDINIMKASFQEKYRIYLLVIRIDLFKIMFLMIDRVYKYTMKTDIKMFCYL